MGWRINDKDKAARLNGKLTGVIQNLIQNPVIPSLESNCRSKLLAVFIRATKPQSESEIGNETTMFPASTKPTVIEEPEIIVLRQFGERHVLTYIYPPLRRLERMPSNEVYKRILNIITLFTLPYDPPILVDEEKVSKITKLASGIQEGVWQCTELLSICVSRVGNAS